MKLFKMLLILLVALVIDILVFANTTYSLNKRAIQLYPGEKLPVYLKRLLPKDNENDEQDYINVYWKNMYYNNNNGDKMPAYSLNKPSEIEINNESKSVDIQNVISLKLWRIITEGYPYVNYSELGCNNEEEAYVATQYAAYCSFNKNNIEGYLGVGEAGKRIFNAAKVILERGKASQENRVDSKLDIIPEINEWKIENSNLYKTYTVSAKAKFEKFNIYLTSEDKKLLEKIKVVDINNQSKEDFEANEQFKIIVPMEQVGNDGKFNINVSAQVKTNPIYFVEEEKKQIQRYAITEIYEEGSGKLNEEFNIIEKEIVSEKKKLPQTGY